jgi:hypothetical protein
VIITKGVNRLEVGLARAIGNLVVQNNSYARDNLQVLIAFDGGSDVYPISGDVTTFSLPVGIHTYRIVAPVTDSFYEGSFTISLNQNTTIGVPFGRNTYKFFTAYVVQLPDGLVTAGVNGTLDYLNNQGQRYTIIYQSNWNVALGHLYIVYSANTYSFLSQTAYDNLVASGTPHILLYTY